MTDPIRTNVQTAPYPVELEDLVANLVYRDGWHFSLQDQDRDTDPAGNVIGRGLTLVVLISCQDSYDHSVATRVYHYFPVIPATYDRRSWRRWLFDCILKIELHEACEYFTVAGDKPYAPNHGPGRDPYTVHEVGTDEDRRTSFRGVLDE